MESTRSKPHKALSSEICARHATSFPRQPTGTYRTTQQRQGTAEPRPRTADGNDSRIKRRESTFLRKIRTRPGFSGPPKDEGTERNGGWQRFAEIKIRARLRFHIPPKDQGPARHRQSRPAAGTAPHRRSSGSHKAGIPQNEALSPDRQSPLCPKRTAPECSDPEPREGRPGAGYPTADLRQNKKPDTRKRCPAP